MEPDVGLTIYLSGAFFKRASTECRTISNSSPKANLPAFFFFFNQQGWGSCGPYTAGCPAVTRSSILDRYVTTLFQGPGVCMRTPLAASGLIHTHMGWVSNVWEDQSQGRPRSIFQTLEALCSVLSPSIRGLAS